MKTQPFLVNHTGLAINPRKHPLILHPQKSIVVYNYRKPLYLLWPLFHYNSSLHSTCWDRQWFQWECRFTHYVTLSHKRSRRFTAKNGQCRRLGFSSGSWYQHPTDAGKWIQLSWLNLLPCISRACHLLLKQRVWEPISLLSVGFHRYFYTL